MASTAHVVVIDASARRVTVKTTPNKHLSDILDEACTKLGLKTSNYGLKNNNKQVDLSRTFRLSGLPPGAKLELVQLSKSAGVVSVALQLPPGDPEAAGVPNGRLTDKFPGDTTLWQILRRFEEGVAGGGTATGAAATKRNLTQRAQPSTDNGTGRLFYQQPVLNLMNREISSLPDLNKNLAQLGYNSGSVLIRLVFKTTDIPLEEAATQIVQYFEAPEWTHDQDAPEPSQPSTKEEDRSSSTSRPLSVYRPPTSATPSASLLRHDESDYTPTIEHAQLHQAHLTQSTRNKRLPTEAEIAAAEQAKRDELRAIKDVEIRIRFPDQSQVTSTFTQLDSGSSLYSEIRDRMLDARFAAQPFVLKDPSVRHKSGDLLVVPDDPAKNLIVDLGFKGRRLLVFAWAEHASLGARVATSVLKEELRRQAVDVKIDAAAALAVDDQADKGVRVNIGKGQDDKDAAAGGSGKKLPKWLKGLSKK
ncbi:hypothetical protein DV735_g839, partial [Chaetothyriales sp. CBS 134920]